MNLLASALLAALAAAPPPDEKRIAFLLGDMPDEELIAVSAALAASGRRDVLLLDTPGARAANAAFLAAWRPDEVVRAGRFAEGRHGDPLKWEGNPGPVWDRLLPRARRVVVCPAAPRRVLLQAACLAAAAGAPLYVLRGGIDDLRKRIRTWAASEVLAVGDAVRPCRGLDGVEVTALPDEAAVRAAHLTRLGGPVASLVVANPSDRAASVLAPYVAARKRGALLLTGGGGAAGPLIRDALRDARMRGAENLILVGGPGALPTERRHNPAEGKDEHIEMEPATPEGDTPFTLATGRLAHSDRGVLALMLARARLLEGGGPRRALVASNSGGGLPLLELMSRHTTRELADAGYRTTLMAGKSVKPAAIRAALPKSDVFVWEGHYKTLVDDYGFNEWDEPLPPSLLFLQTCLALNEKEAGPLLTRGAVALVGSSSRVYSATGGAFSLAFFSAARHDGQTLGGSLRQAKNFLLAYAILKRGRLDDPALGGANMRSAWAFTLLGDPTLRLPAPEPEPRRPAAVTHAVKGGEILLRLPPAPEEDVAVGDYRARLWSNGRLAGLVRKEGAVRRLAPLAFAEVRLPDAPAGKEPRLTSRLPSGRWVFLWDGRRRTGYLLTMPRADDRELRFRVSWRTPSGDLHGHAPLLQGGGEFAAVRLRGIDEH